MPRKFEKWSVVALAACVAFGPDHASPAAALIVAPAAAMTFVYFAKHILAGFVRWQLFPLYAAILLASVPRLIAPAAALAAPLLGLPGFLPPSSVPLAPWWLLLALVGLAAFLDRVLFPVMVMPPPPGPLRRVRVLRHRFAALVPVAREHPLVDEYPDSRWPEFLHPALPSGAFVPSSRSAAAAAAAVAAGAAAAPTAGVASAMPAGAAGDAYPPAAEAVSLLSPALASVVARQRVGAKECLLAAAAEMAPTEAQRARGRAKAASVSSSGSPGGASGVPSFAPTVFPLTETVMPLHSERPFEVLDLVVTIFYPAAAADAAEKTTTASKADDAESAAAQRAALAALGVLPSPGADLAKTLAETLCEDPLSASLGVIASPARETAPEPASEDGRSYVPPYLSPFEAAATAGFASLPAWLFAALQMVTHSIRSPFAVASAASKVANTLPVKLPPGVTATIIPPNSPSTGLFPVVLLSHGLGGTPEVYLSTAQALASFGHVVVAPAHTDGSASVALPHTAADAFYSVPRSDWLRRRARGERPVGGPASAAAAAAAGEPVPEEAEEEAEAEAEVEDAKAGESLDSLDDIIDEHGRLRPHPLSRRRRRSSAHTNVPPAPPVALPWGVAELEAAVAVNRKASADAAGAGSDPVVAAADRVGARAKARAKARGNEEEGDDDEDGWGTWDPRAEYAWVQDELNTDDDKVRLPTSTTAAAAPVLPLHLPSYIERPPVAFRCEPPLLTEARREREFRQAQLLRRAREARFTLDVLALAHRAGWDPAVEIAVRSDRVCFAPEVYVAGEQITPDAATSDCGPGAWVSHPLYPLLGAPVARTRAEYPAAGGHGKDGVFTVFTLGDLIPSLLPRTVSIPASAAAAAAAEAHKALVMPMSPLAPEFAASDDDPDAGARADAGGPMRLSAFTHITASPPSLTPTSSTPASASSPSSAGVSIFLPAVPAPPRGSMDFSRLWVAGHSFGGATSLLSSARDPRVRACAVTDPWIYPTPPVAHQGDVPLHGGQAAPVHHPPPAAGARARWLFRQGRRSAATALLKGWGAEDGYWRVSPEGEDKEEKSGGVNGSKRGPCLSLRQPSRLLHPSAALAVGCPAPGRPSSINPSPAPTTPVPVPVLSVTSQTWDRWLIHNNALRRLFALARASHPLSALVVMPGTRHTNFMDAPFWSPAMSAWLDAQGTTDHVGCAVGFTRIISAFAAAALADPGAASAAAALSKGSCGGDDWGALARKPRVEPPTLGAALRMHVAVAVAGDRAAGPARRRGQGAGGGKARTAVLRALEAVAESVGAAMNDATRLQDEDVSGGASAPVAADSAAVAALSQLPGDWTVVEEAAIRGGPGSAALGAAPADPLLRALAGGACPGASAAAVLGQGAAKELLRRAAEDVFSVDPLAPSMMESISTEAFV